VPGQNSILTLLFMLASTIVSAQQKAIDSLKVKTDTIVIKQIDPLAPTRAAFLSAIVPGLGQAYNKRYWKIPIVYGAIGTGVYFYVDNNSKYHRFRDAYKKRIAGIPDEYLGQYSNATLINAQRTFQRNRDLSLLVTLGLYALNIVDANVDAHLQQFNVNDRLTLHPEIYPNDINYKQNVGMTLKYSF
jgi:hypothetical protein